MGDFFCDIDNRVCQEIKPNDRPVPKICTIQTALGFLDDLNIFIENTGDAKLMDAMLLLKSIRGIEGIQFQLRALQLCSTVKKVN